MKPGIYSLSAEIYHADDLCEQPSLSASIASLICSRSPLHAWAAHPRLNPDYTRQEEGKFDVGTVAHSLLLEGKPMEEAARIVYMDSWRTKAAKELREEARTEGKVALLEKDADSVRAMLAAASAQLAAIEADPPLFAEGKPEQTLVWDEDGVTCRALVDWLHDDYLAITDYKTTSASADPERWTRTFLTIGADVQSAFHLRGVKALTNTDAVMRYVVQETYPPYALSVVSPGPDVLAVAESKVAYALRRWRECITTGTWPAYPTQVCWAELPPWEDARWGDKLNREEIAA